MKAKKNEGLVYPRWEVIEKLAVQKSKSKTEGIRSILLKNRGINTKKEEKFFFNPIHPTDISVGDLGIKQNCINESIHRVKKALKYKEKVVIYGDYDADGICATAILWETLYTLGIDVIPYIPERFSEGYGINTNSVSELKKKFPELKLIIAIDNGIVANKDISEIQNLGIDVIITDHHQKGKTLPLAFSIIHSDKVCGSALSWIFSRELLTKIKSNIDIESSLDIAAIGTIADQMPLVSFNRSFAKYGILRLRTTKRKGIIALLKTSGIEIENIGTYEINFMIAPRINAMGRLSHAIDSLRLLCTKSDSKSLELANKLNSTNSQRQKIVDQVVLHARETIKNSTSKKVILIAHESYHEGVIGLAAGKLVEEFYKPTIVFYKGAKVSKASARSIPGFNIIEVIRKLDDLLDGGGGHPMAAGFSIATEKIGVFIQRFEEIVESSLTQDILAKKLKIDLALELSDLNQDLYNNIKSFEPSGLGNPAPVFATHDISIIDARLLGKGKKHLKLRIEKGGSVFDAIGFNMGSFYSKLSLGRKISLAYNLDENNWNGNTSLQLRIKDLSFL